MSFELPVKSIVVEQPTRKVVPVIIVVGVISAILTYVVTTSPVGREQVGEAFGIGFDRHSVGTQMQLCRTRGGLEVEERLWALRRLINQIGRSVSHCPRLILGRL